MNIGFAYSNGSLELDYETNKSYVGSLTSLLLRQEGSFRIYPYPDSVEQLTLSNDNIQTSKELFGRFLQLYAIDIMHIISPFDALFRVMNKVWFGHTKMVITLQDVAALLVDNPVSKEAAAFVRSCDLVIVHSEGLLADATKHAGIAPERLLLLSPISKRGWSSAANRSDVTHLASAYKKLIQKKLAVFAPLTLANSREAAYIPLLAPHLMESYNCSFFIEDGAQPEQQPSLNHDEISIRHHADYPESADGYDAVLYQLGNGPEYAYMIPYLSQFPGVVVIHDQTSISDSLRDGLHSARLLVVHSRRMVRGLEAQGFTQLFLCNHPVKIPVMLTLLTEPNFIYSSFITENQQVEEASAVLRCLRRFIDQGRTDIQYTIAIGTDGLSVERLSTLVESLQLSSNVNILTHTSSQYSGIISRSNVGITLRKKSGQEDVFDEAILDWLAYGKPSIVPSNEVYDPFPRELIWQIPADQEELHLYESMLQLYLDKNLRKSIRKQAREFMMASHTVPRYANELNCQIARIINHEEPLIRIDSGSNAYAADSNIGPAEEPIDLEIAPSDTPPEEVIHPEQQPRFSQFHLLPNRFRSIKKGGIRQTYFSYNLDELPGDCTIINASMQIPVISKKMLRVYRIRRGWSQDSFARRRPVCARLPQFKSGIRNLGKGLLYKWDCKEVVQSWRLKAIDNHGILVPYGSLLRRPTLFVEVRYEN